jgi:hypothetical protein
MKLKFETNFRHEATKSLRKANGMDLIKQNIFGFEKLCAFVTSCLMLVRPSGEVLS